jgi:cysteine synthase A
MTDPAPDRPRVADSATDLVGGTPLLALEKFAPNLYGKVESFNPLSSIKDRTAVAMLEAADADGAMGPKTTIVEATSGNTGIGLAHAAAAMDRSIRLVMPESVGEERSQILRALGADVELTPAADGIPGAIERRDEIAADLADVFVPNQFENPANPRAHREGTGPEIAAAIDADVLVASVGTGGTITGIARHFKADLDRSDFEVIAIEPADSRVLTGGEPGSEDIPGLGAGFVPEVLDLDLIDGVERTSAEGARETAREIARETGLLTGISSGAAVRVASRVANRPENGDKTVVTILPDTGERYLQKGLFE